MTKKSKIVQLIFILNCVLFSAVAQNEKDAATFKAIYNEALENGQCYQNLGNLCKQVGARLSASPQADSAVKWGYKLMQSYHFDSVWMQQIQVPRWVRGQENIVEVATGKKLHVTALGGSIGTTKKLEASVVFVDSLPQLALLGKAKIAGKIVIFNRPMDPKNIDTFRSYGGCIDQRYDGAVEAAKYGALAAINRSLTLQTDEHPHTGVMGYSDEIESIPAMAIATADADYLMAQYVTNPNLKISVELGCQSLPDVISYNLIAELKGTEHPERIITVGGHFDSWDLGEGAHDDGAGCMHSLEVLRIFKQLNIQPKNTIRVVFFMNEENGNRGGKAYAKRANELNEQHIFALESDRGGFTPRGFGFEADTATINAINKNWAPLFKPYMVQYFEKGGSGVDIGPLREHYAGKMILSGFIPDSQRYFDFHHAETDVFEAVNQRELELGAASMAALIYLVDSYLWDVFEAK